MYTAEKRESTLLLPLSLFFLTPSAPPSLTLLPHTLCSSLSHSSSSHPLLLLQVVADLQDECGRHGTVIQVKVPRPPGAPASVDQVFGTGVYGKVREGKKEWGVP